MANIAHNHSAVAVAVSSLGSPLPMPSRVVHALTWASNGGGRCTIVIAAGLATYTALLWQRLPVVE